MWDACWKISTLVSMSKWNNTLSTQVSKRKIGQRTLKTEHYPHINWGHNSNDSVCTKGLLVQANHQHINIWWYERACTKYHGPPNIHWNITKQWAVIENLSLKQVDFDNNNVCWTRSLVASIWEYSITIWIKRCEFVNEKIDKNIRSKNKKILISILQEL